MTSRESHTLHRAALAMLIVLQGVMLAALMTKTPPHPPLAVAPFALGPFLGASIAVAVAALVLEAETKAGVIASLLAIVLALVSFGPQKWFDPAIGRIWPAVFAAEAALVGLAYAVLAKARRNR